MRKKLISSKPLIFSLFTLLTFNAAFGQEVYIYKDGDSFRSYCRSEFDKSDLWLPVLLYNGYRSLSEIKTGTPLKIPSMAIRDYYRNEEEIRKRLSQVTAEGAELFAPQKTSEVRKMSAESDELLKNGNILLANKLSKKTLKLLNEVEKICREASNAKIEAKVFDLKGKVDKQPPNIFIWERLHVDDDLIEKDKVRTLKKSYIDIVFKDKSHVFLDENSMMVIQKLRENKLKRVNSSELVLVQGDLQALLGSEPSKNFNMKIPEVKTDIHSNSFWIQRDKKKDVRISNYDGTIKVTSAGKAVIVKKNQGVKVKFKKPPSDPLLLLAAPEDLNYKRGKKEYTLFWEPVKKAKSYQVQVAGDKQFRKDIAVYRTVRKNKIDIPGLDEGVYYWRVRSVNSEGLPGNFSEPAQLVYRKKTSKPFLNVRHALFGDTLKLIIVAEPDNVLWVNDTQVAISKDTTHFPLKLRKGVNLIKIKTLSPEGAISEKTLKINFSGKPEFRFEYPKETDTEKALIRGVFDRDYIVLFNGKEIRSKNKALKKIVTLKPGINKFSVEVADVENRKIIHKEIIKIVYNKN